MAEKKISSKEETQMQQYPRESLSLIEVLDRVLDKGIVIDAWVAVSVIGIELVTIEARVIVASLETYTRYAPTLKKIGPIAGGIRERKRLEEGLEEIEGALEGLPLIGKGQQKTERKQEQPQPTQTRRIPRKKARAKK